MGQEWEGGGGGTWSRSSRIASASASALVAMRLPAPCASAARRPGFATTCDCARACSEAGVGGGVSATGTGWSGSAARVRRRTQRCLGLLEQGRELCSSRRSRCERPVRAQSKLGALRRLCARRGDSALELTALLLKPELHASFELLHRVCEGLQVGRVGGEGWGGRGGGGKRVPTGAARTAAC